MSNFFVKDKYTYERRRITDYSYKSGSNVESQNRINGRFIYGSGDEILNLAEVTANTVHEYKVNADFSHSAGFCVEYTDGTGSGICSVTFLCGENDKFSHQTVFRIKDGNGKAVFDTSLMDFVPDRVRIELSCGNVAGFTLKYAYVLDTLGEYGGQSVFYTCEGGSISDDGGRMVFDFKGQAHIESPEFPDSSSTVYNMLMPRRNTVFMVLDNMSDAKSAKLYYTTTKHPEYSEDACVEVALGEGTKAYYFNLSNTPNCEGRLRSFRFCVDGYGSIAIVRYTFEQEKRPERLAGHILSCTAVSDDSDAGRHICVRATLNRQDAGEFAGGRLCVYTTTPADDDDTPDGKSLVGACQIPEEYDGEVIIINDIPFSDGVTSYLPYQFLAFVEADGKFRKADDRFRIGNYRDFENNPYEFTLPAYEVNVLNCGAVGDGFTDDTDAIQKAIDAAAAYGGGRVTVPGDDSFYGKRYIITNLLLKSGVELHLGDGAVLWQSQLKNDYCYAVTYGHDGVIPGVNWTHCLHVCNLPLIQCHHARKVKITGNGKLRSMDTGSEEGVDMPGYSTGCPDRIHQITLGFYEVKGIEFRDFEIVRSNNYHLGCYGCSDICFANMMLHEVKCVSGDGFGMMATHNVYVNRCYYQSNDDGIVMTAVYHDPRGILWWTSRPGEDQSIYNIRVEHCYLNSGGGKAIAFITWGTSDENQEREEIRDVQVYDNYLVCVNPVGAWHDNPYAGKQPFDNTDTDDYSPVHRVRILGNRYDGNCTLGPIHPTDTVTDCGIHSWNDFRNGDFSLGGLANWDYVRNSNPDSVRTVIYADKRKGMLEEFGEGKASLYEGLYLEAGEHCFNSEIMTGQSGVVMFAEKYNGTLLAQQVYTSQVPSDACLTFTLDDDSDVHIGFRTAGTGDGFAMVDNCRIISKIDREASVCRKKKAFLSAVGENFKLTPEMSAEYDNGKVYLNVRAQDKDVLLAATDEYGDMELCATVRTNEVTANGGNSGFGFMFGADSDNGGCYLLRSFGKERELRLVHVVDGKPECVWRRTNFYFTSTDFHMFALTVRGGRLYIRIDGSMYVNTSLDGNYRGGAAVLISGIDASLTGISIRSL